MLEFPPTMPFTSQVTAVLTDVVVVVFERFTTAVKSVCAPRLTVAVDGVMETEVTVTVVLPPPHPESIPINVSTAENTRVERGRFAISEVPFGYAHKSARNVRQPERPEGNSNNGVQMTKEPTNSANRQPWH
jgi:hypothetical protein